jgi:Zn-dependent protease
MTFLADLLRSLYFLARAAIDALLGRRRKLYLASVAIDAPLDLVWGVASARCVTFEGPPRIELATELRPGTPDVYDGTVVVNQRVTPMSYRELERTPPQRLVIEILNEGTAPAVVYGNDHHVVCTLAEEPRGTRLTVAHELTHTGFWGRVLVPLGAVQSARRLRRHCETLAGTSTERPVNRVAAAVMTGLLTYASFIYLFDWRFAAILLALIVVHEAGHALAMRWVGQPVQGIYFIPFFGGVAVASAPHRSEGERGFVALMGPGFSLLTTAAFLVAAAITGEPLFHSLALVSSILNGINLAPVLPLDGGHVVDAAMSRGDPELIAMINLLALIAGIGVAVYLEWYVLIALLLLTAPALMRQRRPRVTEPISIASRNWLLAGYMATLAFYVAVVTHLMV